MNEQITISCNLTKEDLKCVVCFDGISPPFIQCNAANHFVCNLCYNKLPTDNCPCCRSLKLFNNIQLEQMLSEYLTDCSFSMCSSKVFNWELDEHLRDCRHAPTKCFFCEALVESNQLISHLKENCLDLVVCRDANNTTGSLTLFQHFDVSRKRNAVKIELNKIPTSFAFIIIDLVICFRKDDNWKLAVVGSPKYEIDFYIKGKKSKSFQDQTILTINAVETLKELPHLDELATISLDQAKIEFVVGENDDSASFASLSTVDSREFFHNLLN